MSDSSCRQDNHESSWLQVLGSEIEPRDEIHGVRKEKERLTAASISGFLSLPFTMNQMSVVPSLEEVVAKEFSVDLFQDRNVSAYKLLQHEPVAAGLDLPLARPSS